MFIFLASILPIDFYPVLLPSIQFHSSSYLQFYSILPSEYLQYLPFHVHPPFARPPSQLSICPSIIQTPPHQHHLLCPLPSLLDGVLPGTITPRVLSMLTPGQIKLGCRSSVPRLVSLETPRPCFPMNILIIISNSPTHTQPHTHTHHIPPHLGSLQFLHMPLPPTE